MRWSLDGIPETRKGSRRLNDVKLDGAVTSIYEYRRPDGSSHVRTIFVTAGEKLYKYDEDLKVFQELYTLSSTDRPSWITFTDAGGGSCAYMANGTDFIKLDNETVSQVTFISGVDAPRYLMVYDNRAMASGCDNNPYRVFQSNLRNADDWYYDDAGGEDYSAHYWTIEVANGHRITGLGTNYEFGLIFSDNSIYMITEADVESDTSKMIRISSEYGCTSHWAIQTIGNIVYFCDADNFYRGILRNEIENGMSIYPISDNIKKKYSGIKDPYDIISVYDPKFRDIQWSCIIDSLSIKDIVFVYSQGLSGDKGDLGWVNVWSGWFEGLNVHSFGEMLDENGKTVIWSGDCEGFVYAMYESSMWKDERLGDELVTNPSMENDSDWTAQGGSTTSAQSSDEHHSGNYSRKVTLDGSGTAGSIKQLITTVTGSRYLYSGWFRGNGLYLDNPNNKFYVTFGGDTEYSNELSNDVWTNINSTITVDNTSFLVVCGIAATDANNASDSFYVDDVSVRELQTVDIESEIITAPIVLSGISVEKRCDSFTPILHQFTDESTYIQWIVDGSYLRPNDSGDERYITLQNLIPYWRESTDTDYGQKWDTSIWTDRAFIIRPVGIHTPFRYIQFRLYNAGGNTHDQIAYAGAEIGYTVISKQHTQG